MNAPVSGLQQKNISSIYLFRDKNSKIKTFKKLKRLKVKRKKKVSIYFVFLEINNLLLHNSVFWSIYVSVIEISYNFIHF